MGTRSFRGRWVVVVTCGELAGFLVPATVGAVTAGRGWGVLLPVLVTAGAAEGAVLGWSQAVVLGSVLPRLRRAAWVGLTAAGAAGAWALGMLPSTAYGVWSGWPTPLVVVLGVVLASALLATIGLAQWFELRRHVPVAGRWVVTTAVAWLAGLGVFGLVTTPLWHAGQSWVEGVLVGMLGAVGMALAMASVTGTGLVWLLRDAGVLEASRRQAPEVSRSAFSSFGGVTKR